MEKYKMIGAVTDEMTLPEIQQYVLEVLEYRGLNNETPKEKLLLLVEEVGELAKAIRKEDSCTSVDRERLDNFDTVENEAADVFIVLLSLCNAANVDLLEAFINKEKKNVDRNWSKAKD